MASIPYRRFGANILAKSFIVDGVKAVIATATASRSAYAGRTTRLDAVAGFAVTLPASSGSGNKYRFVVGTALTSGTYVVKVANATDIMAGGVLINDTGDSSAATVDYFPTASTSDTYTMTQAIGGGKVGDWFEVEDFKSGTWVVHGVQQGVTDPTTPFSASVS